MLSLHGEQQADGEHGEAEYDEDDEEEHEVHGRRGRARRRDERRGRDGRDDVGLQFELIARSSAFEAFARRARCAPEPRAAASTTR